MKFTTHEEYVIYCAEWKARYLETSQSIRKAALEFHDAQQAFSKIYDSFDWNIYLNKSHRAMESARAKLHDFKQQTADLLLERANSKIEAGRQRELRLSTSRYQSSSKNILTRLLKHIYSLCALK